MSKDTIKILKSSNAVIAVLVLGLLAQIPHAQHVFYTSSQGANFWTWLEAVMGAIALDGAVLVFAVRGNVKVSWGFAAFSVFINLIYYQKPDMIWYIPDKSWLLSAGIPIAIALYSHEVVEDPKECTDEPKQQPAKRTTRTVRSVQTIEASEQVEDTPVQFAVVDSVQLEDNCVQVDLTSLSIEQKKVYALQALRDESVNISKLARDLGIKRRQILYEWKAELDA